MKIDKKKFFLMLVAIFTIVILLSGATYAYFTGNIISNSSRTNANVNLGAIDNIALQQLNTNLHITLNPKDMAYATMGDYYATTDSNKDYEKEENIVSIASLNADGGDANASYNCEVNIKVTVKNNADMLSSLKDGDAEVYLSAGDLLETLDLSTIKEVKTKQYTANILLMNNSQEFINAYLKITNNESDQFDLANKNLSVDIDSKVVKCEVVGRNNIVLALRNTSTSGTLSKNLTGGMYRYQGSANEVTDNYICFGTSDSQACKEHPEQYMYRIIGVTPDGRIKVIKKEALDQTYQWYTDYVTDVKLPDSEVYKAINGSGFLTNDNYVPAGWEDKISNNIWTYGDMISSDQLGAHQTGEELYKAETGKKPTKWNNLADEYTEGALQMAVGFQDSEYYQDILYYTEKNGLWSKKYISKVGLMYLHDYNYSVSDELDCEKNANNNEVCKNGWINLSNNDISASVNPEGTMSRYGWYPWAGYFGWNYIDTKGFYSNTWTIYEMSIRPVFYLNSNINISGSGTTEEPYMIEM